MTGARAPNAAEVAAYAKRLRAEVPRPVFVEEFLALPTDVREQVLAAHPDLDPRAMPRRPRDREVAAHFMAERVKAHGLPATLGEFLAHDSASRERMLAFAERRGLDFDPRELPDDRDHDARREDADRLQRIGLLATRAPHDPAARAELAKLRPAKVWNAPEDDSP